MLRSHYCGTRQDLPPNYLRRGTPYECLRTGVGVGKAIAADIHMMQPDHDAEPPLPPPPRRAPMFPIFLLLFCLTALLMWHRSLPLQGEGQA